MNWLKQMVANRAGLGVILLRVVGIFSLITCFGIACTGENPELSRKKLEVILREDLKAIVEGVAPKNLLEQPHYNLVFYKSYKKSDYSIKAIADFYFLKDLKVKVVRKYRFVKAQGMWERYFNEYKSLPDSTSVDSTK